MAGVGLAAGIGVVAGHTIGLGRVGAAACGCIADAEVVALVRCRTRHQVGPGANAALQRSGGERLGEEGRATMTFNCRQLLPCILVLQPAHALPLKLQPRPYPATGGVPWGVIAAIVLRPFSTAKLQRV